MYYRSNPTDCDEKIAEKSVFSGIRFVVSNVNIVRKSKDYIE